MFFNNLRVALGIISGLFITAFLAVIGIPIALISKPLQWLFGWKRNPASHIIPLWSFLVEEISVRFFMGMKIYAEGTVPPARENEVIVCIGNHPSTIATASFVRLVASRICTDILAVSKIEHLKNPIIGWPLKVLGSGIFVNRKSAEESNNAIDKGLTQLVRSPSALVIFPDSTRPTREKITTDLKQFVDKIPGLGEWLLHTTVPRSGGLFHLLNNLGNENVRIVNITTACSKDDTVADDHPKNIFTSGHLLGSTLTMKIENVEIPHKTREEIKNWLNENCKQQNYFIKDRRE